jgi:hypothetical protein
MSVCYRFTLSIAVVVGPAPLWCRLIVSCLVSSAGIEDFVSHSAILVIPLMPPGTHHVFSLRVACPELSSKAYRDTLPCRSAPIYVGPAWYLWKSGCKTPRQSSSIT